MKELSLLGRCRAIDHYIIMRAPFLLRLWHSFSWLLSGLAKIWLRQSYISSSILAPGGESCFMLEWSISFVHVSITHHLSGYRCYLGYRAARLLICGSTVSPGNGFDENTRTPVPAGTIKNMRYAFAFGRMRSMPVCRAIACECATTIFGR